MICPISKRFLRHPSLNSPPSSRLVSPGCRAYPVYNGRVSLALAGFGYRHPRGASPADKYIAYRNAMRKFAEACGTNGTKPDVLALDAFFLMRSKLSEKKPVKKE